MSAAASPQRSQSLNSAALSKTMNDADDSMVMNMKASWAQARPSLATYEKSTSSLTSSPGSVRDIITPVSYWDSFRGIDSSSQSFSAPLSYEASNGDNTMDLGLYKPKH
mmetsp:Transcript_2875/g.6121  ORF Transcript_2875/g.6121 Transcript_2875/m.6121 type:complete len:109 (-) Transcript_2875:333-659(-)|eukprot:CAMPEP_0168752182 /NCGR_PEP_ID=MMETSP0724-20121128/18250_1 /TAXON_ID=265536 /ORGANISM="Amphiprora sp., Strain CCMP467" /LENGTH=108 /DNA_ID=CAMNT_0008800415 /DNA_START=128 /DNA_END=454 /DNA_ORIENTATION=-